MKNIRLLLNLIFCIAFFNAAVSQNIGVVSISGDVKIKSAKDTKQSPKNLTYGVITPDKQLVLGKNSMVKLRKSSGEECELTAQGSYLVRDLPYKLPVEKSIITRLSEYFMNFFNAHPSSESKERYQNSIYAISRGNIITPVPVFPFEGKMPLINNSILFKWDIACDTCHYELVIKDIFSRKEVFRHSCDGKEFILNNADQVLNVGGKYYWYVKVANQSTISTNIIFDLVSSNEYESELGNIEKNFTEAGVALPLEFRLVSSIGELESKELTNFAYLYGTYFVSKHAENKALNELFEQFVYSKLSNSER
jgi:hypothetical protein